MSTAKTKKMQIGILLIALLAVCFFAYLKQGFFMDELYSYGLSNSEGRTDISDYDIYDREITDDPWDDYLEVQPGEGFQYKEVVESQIRDVHPPLYYMMLHTVCSMMPDEFSKWSGLIPNILLYLLTIILLYAMGRQMMGDGVISVMPAAIWAISAMGIGTAVYIRMYMLLTLLTTWDIYLHVQLIKNGPSGRRLVLIAICTIMGYLTQYYFLIAAFWLSLIYLISLIKQRNYHDSAVYAGVRLASLIAGVLAFPQVFAQLRGQDNEYVSSLVSTPSFIQKLLTNSIAFISDINYGMCGGIAVIAVVLLVIIWIISYRKDTSRDHQDEKTALAVTSQDRIALMLVSIIALDILTIILVSWIPARRYYFNIMPTACVIFSYMIYRLSDRIRDNHISSISVLLTIVLMVGINLLAYAMTIGGAEGYISYMYIGNQKIYQDISQASIEKCIYITDHRNAAITQDLDILRQMDWVYIAKPDEYESALADIDADEPILLIVDKDYEKDIELPNTSDEIYSRELSVGYIASGDVSR